MTDDMTIQVDSDEYVVRREGDGLKVGRRMSGEVTWLETVDYDLLPADARDALERGDSSNEALLIALRGVVQAEVERGG